MKRFLLFIALVTVIIACDKDKFKTEPQVEIIDFGPSEIFIGEAFALRAVIRDKEGDLKDTVYLVRQRYNVGELTPLTTDTIPIAISEFEFPDNPRIEVTANFIYGQFIPGYIFINQESEDRELAFGIIVKDEAGNKSEYLETDRVLLKKP